MARLLQHFLPVFSFGLALDEKVAAHRRRSRRRRGGARAN